MNEKGVSTTVEALLLISLSSILVFIVLINFYNLNSSVQRSYALEEAYNVASKIAREVISIADADYAKKRLKIPPTIGGEPYMITFKDQTIIIENRKVSVSLPVPISLKDSSASSYNVYLIVRDGFLEVKNE